MRAFNAKITRLEKKYPDKVVYFPKRIKTSDIYGIENRKDFNKAINSYQRFLRKGQEVIVETKGGVITTKWAIDELKIKKRIVNLRRSIARKKANVSTYTGTMHTIEENQLRPLEKDIEKLYPGQFQTFSYKLEKHAKSQYYKEQDELYKENYLQALITVFDYLAGEIYQIVEKIPASTLVSLYYKYPVLQIDFIYDPLEMEIIKDAIIEKLKDLGYE